MAPRAQLQTLGDHWTCLEFASERSDISAEIDRLQREEANRG